jgi:hypothetical protein
VLTEFWRDLLSLVSLGLTVVGFILTALGLWYAILQIRKTKSAVEAAEEAANRALAESERNFQRYAAANAHRFINEAKMHVDGKAWEKAAMRLRRDFKT